MPKLLTGGSIIQGSIPGAKPPEGTVAPGNLEAVIGREQADGTLEIRHYWRDLSQSAFAWKVGSTITTTAVGPAAITQRPRVSDVVHGNFEVVVPERDGNEVGLAHYWMDPADPAHPWHRHSLHGWAAPHADGPGAVVHNRVNNNLDVVALHGSDLVHHWFDGEYWRRGSTISTTASGAPTLMQSRYHDHLEVIVVEGGYLVLYFLDGAAFGALWRFGGRVTNAGDGPHGAVQGRYGVDPNRNFEVLVPRGDDAVGYWRDNSRTDLPWRPAGVATWGAGRVEAVALCSTTVDGGWLHALTQEDTSIYNLYRHRIGGGFRWMRGACVRLDDRSPIDDASEPRSRKLAQVTGEIDRQTGAATLSNSLAVSGVRGTDLGVSFTHDGRHFLLFGDTHWEKYDWRTLDSIAEVRTNDVGRRPQVELHGAPLKVIGGDGVTQTEFDVPLDGFSLEGEAFVLLSSNHACDGKVMGRSVLTRCLDPRLSLSGAARNDDDMPRLQFLTTLSTYRFINASVQFVPAATIPGLAGGGDVLMLWGTGAYRADDLRLAYLDLRDPAVWSFLRDDQPFDARVLGLRYFTGTCGDSPQWSAYEDEARPLFFPAALGEISVRWVPELRRYVLLYATGPEENPTPCKVFMRTAPAPWGPWSPRRVVFDWYLDGMGYRQHVRHGRHAFIHSTERPVDDCLGDCIFDEQCHTSGAGYAPYLFDAVPGHGYVTLRYLLSTWNPYQVTLMAHDAPKDAYL